MAGSAVDAAGADETLAYGINGAGQIVGTYGVNEGGGGGGGVVVPVPEPPGLVLLGTGAVGLLGYGAWRRARPRA